MQRLYDSDLVALIEMSWALEYYTGEEDLRNEGMDHEYFATLSTKVIAPEGKITEDVADVMGQCLEEKNGTWTLYDLPPVIQVFVVDGGDGPSGMDQC
jgi:hypothetical protein